MHLMYTLDENGNRIYTLKVSQSPYGAMRALCERTPYDGARLTRESLCLICLLLVGECIDALPGHKSTVTHPTSAAMMRAVQLRCNMQSLARAAEISICIARAVNAPLHFLTRYYAQVGDTAGLEWCA